MPHTASKRDILGIIAMCLGGLWLLDGILQLQPAMFTNAFVGQVLSPNLQSQPTAISNIINFGITAWNINPFLSNLFSALIQLLIGALLLLPLRNAARRFGLWLSIFWALIVWVFGEGFGNLFTGNATFYTGAPGSALLYLIIAIFLLYPKILPSKKLPMVAGVFFLAGAALNLAPMFWQSTMLGMLSVMPAISGPLGAIGSQGTAIGNILAVAMLAWLGMFLILMPNRATAWVVVVFLVLVWALGQNFGLLQTFPGGTATDPNSAPLFILLILPTLLMGKETQS